MKKRMRSVISTGRKSRLLEAVCVMTVLLMTVLSVNAFAVSGDAGQYIGQAKAKSIALSNAGLSESQVTKMKVELDRENGTMVYEVEFRNDRTKYEYDIDAANGDILKYDFETSKASASGNQTSGQQSAGDTGQYIDEANAKSIALEHAGISEQQATFTKARLDRDDGRVVYELKFYSSSTKYDYEIDAVSGDIREHGRKTEQSTQQPASGDSSQYINEANAKSIALSAAGLSESQIRKMKVKLDREHGTMVYEVEFENGKMEYEYEIDPISGVILKSDIEYDD